MSEKNLNKVNNIYKEIRTELGYSREKACELMNYYINPDRLEKIENDKVLLVTPEEVVQ